MPVASQDYYEALGVPRDASADDIRRAYRNLARRLHPDVNKEPGAEDRFKAISEAYEVLRDPEKRASYDDFGAQWRTGREPPGGSAGNGSDRGSGFHDVRVDFGSGGFGDIFERPLRRAHRACRPRGGFEGFSFRGGDQEAELSSRWRRRRRGAGVGCRSETVASRGRDPARRA